MKESSKGAKISKKKFASLLNKNAIDMKSYKDFSIIDSFKIFVLKRPYLAIIMKKISSIAKAVPEDRYFNIVNFFFERGIIIHFDGDIVAYLSKVFVEIINKYYPTTADSAAVKKKKIDVLYALFSEVVENGDKYASSFVASSILPIINKYI